MCAIDAVRAGAAGLPVLMRCTMVSATVRPWKPEGMPVRGGAGATGAPLGVW